MIILKASTLGGVPLAAGQTASISVWPPILTAMVKPGKSITQVYRFKNSADDTAATISLVPFTAADEYGHVGLQFGQPVPNFFSLLNADLPKLPVTLNLKAGETQELVLKISIPSGAEEIDYPVALVAETNTQGLIGGSGTTANAIIASPILLTVSESGLPQRVAQIAEFSTNIIVDSFDQIAFLLRVKNQSYSLLQPIGQITIKNIFGRTVATLPIEPDNILGGTVRQLRFPAWNPVFPLGRYTAEATLAPQDTTNTISGKVSFWAIPYKAILTLLILFSGWRLLTNYLKKAKV